MPFNAFKNSMLDCEIIRNGRVIANHKGLINDTKDYNFISFEPGTDIQVNDDIFCKIKNKHYIIINVDLKTFHGDLHSVDAYFENNFSKPVQTTVFNTYNPSNSIIGSQQYAVININDSFKKFNEKIETINDEYDKQQLIEFKDMLQQELESNNSLTKMIFTKFNYLFAKYPWVLPLITEIIVAWIQG